MSGVASEHLFELIKSLSGPEKRYFRTFARKGLVKENSVYLLLFDAIAAQKQYDERAILRRRKRIRPAQLSNLKKYLYDLLLDSLRSFHAGKSVDIKLRAMLDSLELLYDRRLTDQCYRLLGRARKLAMRYEKNGLMVDIIFWEEKIAGMGPRRGDKTESILAIYDTVEVAMDRLRSTTAYSRIFRQVVETFRKEGILREQKTDEALQKIMQKPSLKNEGKLLSFHDRYYFYSIHSIYHLLRANWPTHYSYQKKVVTLFESNPLQIEDSPNTYLASLNTYLICCQFTGKRDELLATFEKVRTYVMQNKRSLTGNSLVQVLGCYNSMLHHHTQTGQFEKGVKLFREVESRLDPVRLRMNRSLEMSIYYTLAYIFFGAKDYRTSLHWLNKIINTPYPEGVRDDIQSFARIFNLIVHYELDNKELLEHIVRSTYRFLYQRKRLYRMESLVLNFIRKNSWVNTPAEMLVSFEGLKQEILKISNNPYEKKALSYFNLLAWLESKTGGRDFAAIMKDQH